jgi:hypothetical protein
MAMHMVAYNQTASTANVLTPIAAIADGTVRVVGNDVYVPKGMNNILGAGALINSATGLRAQVQSPALRANLNYDVEPIVNALVFGSYPPFDFNPTTPIPIAENEPLEFWVLNNLSVANYGLILLGDGPVKPVTGKVYTVRATGAATLAAGTWVNTALTFSQSLPAGHYQVVGFRADGTNLVAARIFFVGSPWRPGVPAVNSVTHGDPFGFREGDCGILGEFDNTLPPTVDCLGVTDTAQTFLLDLIKTG